MGPTGNLQGSIKLMCLKKGNKIVRRKYTRLPVPDSAIRDVEALVVQDRTRMGISFRNRNHEEFEWENEDYAIKESGTNNAPYPDLPAEFPDIDLTKDHPTPAMTEDESENPDDNDKKVAAVEANCDFGEMLTQNKMKHKKKTRP